MDQITMRLELIKHIITSKPTATDSSDDSTLGQTA
jgi:hypothetical protein